MSSYLSPIQLGIGVPDGSEAAVHSLRRYVNTMGDDDIIVKLEFADAFNTLRRDTLIETMAKFIPEIFCFVFFSFMQHILVNQFYNL